MPAVATKKLPCPRKIWKDGEKTPCPHLLTISEKCPNAAIHIAKYKTGFCGNGQCEGTRPKSPSGQPMKTCEFYLTCPCKCHADLWLMSKMTGVDRQLHENPERIIPRRAFWMPSDEPDWSPEPLSIPDDTTTPEPVESPSPALIPASTARVYTTTATGRTPKGQLEAWVKHQCDVWLLEGYTFLCTPVWIAEEIASDQAIDPPSVGAICSVFDRWTKLGFAVIEKKPIRFTGYTEAGIRLGLEKMKANAKSASKREKAERFRQNVR